MRDPGIYVYKLNFEINFGDEFCDNGKWNVVVQEVSKLGHFVKNVTNM
jgi:hypothetical protein